MNKEDIPYYFHSDFILRTPLVPLKSELMTADKLYIYSQQLFFKEAIYLASPVLYDELIKWHSGDIKEQKEIDKLIVSVYKYYSRMQSRCTPYGLFAGCTVGSWAKKNNITLNSSIKRHTRLDMNFLCALAQKLNSHPSIYPFLRFFPNNSAYVLGEQLRYVEYSYSNNRRIHQISSVEYTSYLQLVLDKAKTGATPNELAQLLVDDEITYEEASNFIKELIDSQVIVSDLEPAVTGDEFIHHIISTLKNIQGNKDIEEIIQLLKTSQEQISRLDEKLGNDIELYRNIHQQLELLSVPIEENYLFQTDLYKTTQSALLDTNIQNQLNEVIDFLNRFSHPAENGDLKKFKKKFYDRYEGTEMPLLEILDVETGIGYPNNDVSGVNNLLNDLIVLNKPSNSYDLKWDKREGILHNLLQTAFKNNEYTIVFTENDIKEIEGKLSSLPDSLAIMFRMIDSDKICLNSIGGSSAANLLGRFAHGDKAIYNDIKDITEHEQNVNKNKILAEIVHLPESRIGNILLRPVFRDYEIPYLGKSALPLDNQIQVQDLVVSLQNNTIILRSKKLNKEIIPRLSAAHNYSLNALPVYRFLCDMQTQYYEKSGLGFNWGALSNRYKFLPRTEFKNVILSRAKWQLAKKEFQILLDEQHPYYMNEVNKWRSFLKMPQLVVLAESDNELLINFEDPLSIKMLASTIRKKERIILEEYLFDSNDLLVKDNEGHGYTNEFIAVRLNNKTQVPLLQNKPSLHNTQPLTQRDFYMGSEWIYYKIYCGVKTTDTLLTEVIKPLMEEIIQKGLADKFFFIRYADPDTHIRFRIHTKDLVNIGEIISIVHQYFNACINTGTIYKMQTDVYKRELERYGDNSIELAESFFYVDSLATLSLLSLIDSDEAGNQIRWQFAILTIDELLNTFEYTIAGKLALLENLKEGFFKEHGGQKELKIQLDTKFRNIRKPVEVILGAELDSMEEFAPLIEVLKWKGEELKPIAEKLLELKNNNLLKIDLDDLMSSYIHMMMNRIFMGRQRTCEMVIYDLLFRSYTSRKAREKSKKTYSDNLMPSKIAVTEVA